MWRMADKAVNRQIRLNTTKIQYDFINLLAQSANGSVVILLRWQSFFCAYQFHQHNHAQLYNYAQLDNTLNFYSALHACKFSINLLQLLRQ
jgi:hypothetical protein